jgi:hypothetical protein
MFLAGKQRVHVGLEITRDIIVYIQHETNREETTVTKAGLVCFLPGE